MFVVEVSHQARLPRPRRRVAPVEFVVFLGARDGGLDLVQWCVTGDDVLVELDRHETADDRTDPVDLDQRETHVYHHSNYATSRSVFVMKNHVKKTIAGFEVFTNEQTANQDNTALTGSVSELL